MKDYYYITESALTNVVIEVAVNEQKSSVRISLINITPRGSNLLKLLQFNFESTFKNCYFLQFYNALQILPNELSFSFTYLY